MFQKGLLVYLRIWGSLKMNTENKIPLLNRDLPFPINYEDFYITQNDLMYEQIRSNG